MQSTYQQTNKHTNTHIHLPEKKNLISNCAAANIIHKYKHQNMKKRKIKQTYK